MEEYEMCRHCKKDIPVANYRTHTVHCAKNATKVGKENTTKTSSNSDEPMLPCEFCDDLIPMRKLLEHQAECVNPSNVRRNDSCSSMLSRNSSNASSIRPSHSNTSTSLNRSTSSVNTQKHGSTRSSNYLSPSTANGDSGFCTSPRPESTQSTISTTNGHRNASKEESLCSKKEEDFQEERVPCEFCGELRIRETIMRHQRHCSLNPRRSAVEVTANTTYDTTSLRRSQARRNYSLNRTNSVREARATTEDRTFGGSRLSRQSSFSERSRWRDAGGGTVNMGLSVIPKADYTSYGRLGRPGYDYAAATRRSGLFDGYTGFAIYSSISQGLDEITYGGRRSRRNSISENTYGTSGTSLSRRGSFANISDYSAMLAASAAIEAATKPKQEEDDDSFVKNTYKNEKKGDTCNLDNTYKGEKKGDTCNAELTPSHTYSNSTKISRQSSVAYQSDSAFSESSPGLSSKYSHQSQISKTNVTTSYNSHSTQNEKQTVKESTVVSNLKLQDALSPQRTLSPSCFEVSKPQSILSRQDSLTHSQSATKIERKVSFTDGPIKSPVQRPDSTMDKEGKREKRKKDKENETAEEKEARRAERRKRRALKELKKLEKSKEKDGDLANGENCGALLIEVSQKLLALEKEQQDSPDSPDVRESMKSPLEVIPPSSLLSGINDERSSQLQILQKQKQQQQEHLREQQRVEQERIDEQKMIEQQQKWLLQNEQMLKQGKESNNETIQSCNAINDVKNELDIKTTGNLDNENVNISQNGDTHVKDKFILDPKDEAIKRLDSTIVEKQNAEDEVEDSGNGSDPSAASSPTTASKKGHLLNGTSMSDLNDSEVVLREKDGDAPKQDKNASKRNSLDGKTVQGLAQDLAAECAKAYALMENSLSKFSNDFGPFGKTPRNRKKSKQREA